MNSSTAIEVSGLSYAYPDGTAALDGIDLRVSTGEAVGLAGSNGAGKSTLLLHLNGILRPRAGTVKVFGAEVARATLEWARQKVGLVFQNPDDQLFCPTLFDDVAFGPRNLRLSDAEVADRVETALRRVGLSGLERKSAFHLSFGEKKRAALAAVLAMDPPILVMDEPTSNLDPRGRRELIAWLENWDKTLIIATHDLDLLRQICGRVVLVHRGKCAADGAPREILDDSSLLEAHGL